MRVRGLLGYVPQQLSIDGQLSGYEYVWLFVRLFERPKARAAPAGRGRPRGVFAALVAEEVEPAGRMRDVRITRRTIGRMG
jgi:ABC-2 type transport system ATP-binding protein